MKPLINELLMKEGIDENARNLLNELGRCELEVMCHEVDLEIAKEIKRISPYSEKINENIHTLAQLRYFKSNGYKEVTIGERTALIKNDIDLEYEVYNYKRKGIETNAERIKSGRAPFDVQSGEIITLHHLGQYMNSPLAEITEGEHFRNNTLLHHKLSIPSDIDRAEFKKERVEYWKNRYNQLEKK